MTENKEEFTEEEFLEWLREECVKAGSVLEFCRRNTLSYQPVHDILKGKTAPQPKVLAALGWERNQMYRRITQ